MYGKPPSTDIDETDLNSYHNPHQSLSSYNSPQPPSTYKAMPFGTEVKISSIYELPSESVEASSSYGAPSEASDGYGLSLGSSSTSYKSPSEDSSSYGSPSEATSLYGSPRVPTPGLYGASSPPFSSYGSPQSSAVGTPSTSLAPPSPLAESYVSPPGVGTDEEPFGLETYVPDQPTAPVLNPDDPPTYQPDVVITTEKAKKKGTTIDRVGQKGIVEEVENDFQSGETVVEDVQEGNYTVDAPILSPIGEDKKNSVTDVKILADSTEEEIPARSPTEKEIDKQEPKEIDTKKSDMIEQGDEENEVEGT